MQRRTAMSFVMPSNTIMMLYHLHVCTNANINDPEPNQTITALLGVDCIIASDDDIVSLKVPSTPCLSFEQSHVRIRC